MRKCATGLTVLAMTSAYETGAVPEIQVRHRLRIAREFAGLEQDDLAALMGVARNTVINAEKGHRKPRKIVLNAWALACGVPVSWIENGDTNMPTSGPEGPGGGLPVEPDGGHPNLLVDNLAA